MMDTITEKEFTKIMENLEILPVLFVIIMILLMVAIMMIYHYGELKSSVLQENKKDVIKSSVLQENKKDVIGLLLENLKEEREMEMNRIAEHTESLRKIKHDLSELAGTTGHDLLDLLKRMDKLEREMNEIKFVSIK